MNSRKKRGARNYTGEKCTASSRDHTCSRAAIDIRCDFALGNALAGVDKRTGMPSRLADALFTLLVVVLFLATFSVARVFAEELARMGRRSRRVLRGMANSGLVRWSSTRSYASKATGDGRNLARADLDQEAFGLSSKRVGVEGQLGKRLALKSAASSASSSPWRDVRAQYHLPAGLTVTGGQFKVPLGLDGTKGALERDFVFRSRLADAFSMGRDQGAAIEAKLWRKRITVEAGAFSGNGGARTGDGVGISAKANVKAGTRLTGVVRATVSPFANQGCVQRSPLRRQRRLEQARGGPLRPRASQRCW